MMVTAHFEEGEWYPTDANNKIVSTEGYLT